jgi:hypothetical protein
LSSQTWLGTKLPQATYVALHLGSGKIVLTGVYALFMHLAKLKDARAFKTLRPRVRRGRQARERHSLKMLENLFSVAEGG